MMRKKAFVMMVLVAAFAVSVLGSDARDYVKQVSMVSSGGTYVTGGSAVLIDPKLGLYVTARHVVDGDEDRAKLQLDGKDVELVAESAADDLLFFRAEPVPGLSALEFRGSGDKEKVRALGFVRPSMFSDLIIFTERDGEYLGKAVFKEAPNRFVEMYSASADHGMSGGGLFSQEGALALVGVITNMSGSKRNRSYGCNAAYLPNMIELMKVAKLLDKSFAFKDLPEISKIKV